MVSYAVDGGSVGPHTDNYDVFLLQARGQRHWQIQTENINEHDIRSDTELRILNHFIANDEWTLNPGDILYLPPGIAHHGIAVGDCMTFSIGFRAYSDVELLQMFTDKISVPNDANYYRDMAAPSVGHRGELDQQSLHQFRQMLEVLFSDQQRLDNAIAEYLTEPVGTPALYDAEINLLDNFIDMISKSSSISIHPAVRTLYTRRDDVVSWYIDSTQHQVSHDAADSIMALVDHYRIEQEQIGSLLKDTAVIDALFRLYQQGGLLIE